MKNVIKAKPGFTLIEVIVTLVLVAILGAGLAAFFGTGVTESSVPLNRMQEASDLHKVMENIISEYDAADGPDGRWEAFKTYFPQGVGTYPTPVPTSPKNFLNGVSGGTYTIVFFDYREFNESTNQEQPDGGTQHNQQMVRLTVENDLGESLTTLFTDF